MSEIARKPSYSPVNTPGQLFQRSSLSTPLSPNPRRRTPGRSASDGLQHKASSPTLFRETLKGSSKEVPMLEDSMEDLVAMPLADDLLNSRQKAERSRQFMNSSMSDYSSSPIPIARQNSYGNDDGSGYASESSLENLDGLRYRNRNELPKTRIPSRKNGLSRSTNGASDSESDLSHSKAGSRELPTELAIQMSTFNGGHTLVDPHRAPSVRRDAPNKKARTASDRVPAPASFPHSPGPGTPAKRQPSLSRSQNGPERSPSPRVRAVTGNLQPRKRPSPRIASPAASPARRRSVSTSTISADTFTTPPWSQESTPTIYRSDLMPPPGSLDALSSRSIPNSHSARSFDDQVIPTVAKQLHQQMLAQDIGPDDLVVEYNPDGTPKRKAALNASTSSRGPLDEATPPGQPSSSWQAPEVPANSLEPQEMTQAPAGQPVTMPPALPLPVERKEMWQQPELSSPTTARRTMAQQENAADKFNVRFQAVVKPDDAAEHGGKCCSCVIC